CTPPGERTAAILPLRCQRRSVHEETPRVEEAWVAVRSIK
ncbi:1726_t:CDS:1, partial [Cetraspora pellucida]